MNTIHPFESAGLGTAPFTLVGCSEKVFCPCPGAPSKPGGTCDYCATAIRYCCHIRGADGREFIVGTDCVKKLGRADNRLVSAVNKEVARRLAKARAEKRRAARPAPAPEPVWANKQAWLIEVLEHAPGSFAADLARRLRYESVASQSVRVVDILGDIYGLHHGRRGSAAYNIARDNFDIKLEESQ